MTRVVCAVLAAGASRRLGRPKQLVQFRGKPLVRHVIDATRSTSIAEHAVVLGANAPEVAHVLVGSDVTQLHNDAWTEGLSSSVRAAIAWAERRAASAALLVLVDQPLIDAEHVERLVRPWRDGASAVASAYANVLGVPALFDVRLFPELATLSGEQGAAKILRRLPNVAAVPWPEGALDVDTDDDLDALS